MQIHHTALWVQNLEKAKDFFVRFFDARPSERYHNPETDFESYFLEFETGAKLEIMTRPDVSRAKEGTFVGYAHLAFSTGSKERVDLLTSGLGAAGYTVVRGPRTTGDGYYESCILGPENILVEITE